MRLQPGIGVIAGNYSAFGRVTDISRFAFRCVPGNSLNRRTWLKAALAASVAWAVTPAAARAIRSSPFVERLAALERRHGGRLGVSILDTASGRSASHRGGERFLMCSTFKLLAAAAVLKRVDDGVEDLQRRVVFGDQVLLDYAPVTRLHAGEPGMSIDELCEATVTVSDNTAANLLLDAIGGPAAVTALARSLGDRMTRLDRLEPELNVGSPGDERDTTTPDAMLGSMQRLLLGEALSGASRARLLGWLNACTTGTDKLRAGVPPDWVVGDKTGSGPRRETNDVAILQPPGRASILITAYYAGARADPIQRAAVLAEVGRIAVEIARFEAGAA